MISPLELAHWILDPKTCNVDERHKAVAEALIRREEGVEPKRKVNSVTGQEWWQCAACKHGAEVNEETDDYSRCCGTRLKWLKS